MKLLTMTAWFGRLNGETLRLHDGLNIVTAPNESGKSTWAAFLRVMLYGLDTRARDKKGAPADKNRYRPWSGHPMEGELLLEYEGQRCRLRRWTEGRTPMGAFSMTEEATGLPVEGITAANAGETLLGVSQAVFVRTAFFTQEPIGLTQDQQLERRILSLCSTGEEQVSWTETDKTLQTWLRQLSGPRGTIPTLESARDACADKLSQLEENDRLFTDTRSQILAREREQRQAQQTLDLAARQAQLEQGRRYRAASQELTDAVAHEKSVCDTLCANGSTPPPKAQLQAFLQTCLQLEELTGQQDALRAQQQEDRINLANAQARLQASPWSGLDADSAWEQAHSDTLRCQQAERLLARGKLLTLGGGITSLILGAALAGANYAARGAAAVALGILAALLAGGIWVGGCAVLRRMLHSRQRELLERYHAGDSSEILSQASEYRTLLEISVRLKLDIDKRQSQLEELEGELSPQLAQLLHWVQSFSPSASRLEDAHKALAESIDLWEQLNQAHLRVQSARAVFEAVSAAGPGLEETAGLGDAPPPSPEEVSQANESLNFCLTELKRLENQQAMLHGQRRALGDPAQLAAQLSEQQDRLSQAEERAQALHTARQLLSQANQLLQERFSPRLNARAGAFASQLTGGRYTRLILNRTFALQAEEPDQLADRDAELLSRGTADQLYLAVRLALCDLVLDPAKPCPLVLDDALNHFDNDRLLLALQTLEGLDRQVLLFSCTGREAALMKQGHT